MKRLEHYLQTHTAGAIEALMQFYQSGDAEALHRYRVAMKKIRALMQMTLRLQPHHPKLKKQAEKLKVIFREAGKVRCRQVRLAFFEQQQMLPLVPFAKEGLDQDIQYLQRNAFTYAQNILSAAEVLSAVSASIKAPELEAYVQNLYTQVQKALHANTQEELHDLRKCIKQLLYALNWHKKGYVLKGQTRWRPQLQKLQERIGEWHDLQDHITWLASLQTHMADSPPQLDVVKDFQGTLLRMANHVARGIDRQMKTLHLPTL